MTKAPKEIRDRRNGDRRENPVKNPKNIKCCECGSEEDYKLTDTSMGHLCDECLDQYCERCCSIKPFITVRRDFKNPEHTHKQICSCCYLLLCDSIIKIDSIYGIDTIHENKLTDGE